MNVYIIMGRYRKGVALNSTMWGGFVGALYKRHR